MISFMKLLCHSDRSQRKRVQLTLQEILSHAPITDLHIGMVGLCASCKAKQACLQQCSFPGPGAFWFEAQQNQK